MVKLLQLIESTLPNAKDSLVDQMRLHKSIIVLLFKLAPILPSKPHSEDGSPSTYS